MKPWAVGALLLSLINGTLSASSLNASRYPEVAFRHSLPTRLRPAPTLAGLHGLSRSLSPPSQLHFSQCTAESLSAAAAIACPALVGMQADRLRSGIGPLITIVAASHFSSLGFSPSAHHLYEICWTRFLPASLSLLLLAPSLDEQTHQEARDVEGSTKTRERTRDNAKDEIMAMAIPFLLGCLGSILGCLLSYFYCWLGKDNTHRVHKYILPGRKHLFFQPGRMLLEPTEAAVAAGCLLSSYIGGSMNYFATARMIARDQDLSVDANAGAQGVIQ